MDDLSKTYSWEMLKRDSTRNLKSKELRGFKEIERLYDESRAQIPTTITQIAVALFLPTLLITHKFA